MKRTIRHIFCCLVAIVLSCPAFAQRYPFYNLSVENGLIQSQATCLAQDKAGHLWIGTLGGLSRFDGKGFTNYSVRDGMVNNTVSALTIDKKGNIWVGSTRGVSKFDGRRFTHHVFQSPENPNANAVNEIKEGDDGTIWCIAGSKVYQIKKDTSSTVAVPDKNANITAILPVGKELWAARNGGILYHYHDKKWDSLYIPSPTQPFVTKLFKDSKQRVWITTTAGLYRVVNNGIIAATFSGYTLPGVSSITEDKNGALWLSTNNGAIKVKDSSIQFYNRRNGLTDNPINDVLTDIEGSVWFASDGQGIYRFSGSQFTMLDETMGLPSAQVMSIAASRGRIFLGTFDAGLYTYEGGAIYKVPLPLSPPPAITAIEMRTSFDIWLGTRGSGIWRYDGVAFKSYGFPTIMSNFITCLYHADDKMYMGFANGAMVYKNDSFKRINLKSVPVLDFISIGVDSVLIATNDGIKLYTADNLYAYKTNGAVDSSFAQCFTKKGNELWIGTSDNGVICYNLNTKKSYVINRNNGLQSDFVYNIIDDNDGNIWVGTGYGIHKIDARNSKPAITFYGNEQGITGMESNHNATYKMPDGSIWFGTTKGAVYYRPQAKTASHQPTSIVLQSVKLFGEKINDTTYYDSTEVWYKTPYGLRLPYQKNNITFTFQAVSLAGLEQVQYRYNIDGLDASWSEWAAINTVTYSALPPGKYKFKVQCRSGEGAEVKELVYPFEIITPFHKTGWFKILILAACILLGVTIQYITTKRKQNRFALTERLRREEQSKVRQRTAEDFHDEIGNKLTRINVLADVLKSKLVLVNPETKRIIDQIQENTGQLYSGTRDILWSLKPSNDNLYEILHRIRDFGGDLFQDTNIDFYFLGTDERWRNYKLPLDMSRNLIMIFKEALNNALKYAKAKNVSVEVKLKEGDALQLILKDDGIGFDMHNYKKGHGINNMHIRTKRLHGKIYIDSTPGKGTIINLNFRLPKE